METDERLRSPPRPLRIAHPCGLVFIVTGKLPPMRLELFRGRTERIRFDRKQHFFAIRRKTQ